MGCPLGSQKDYVAPVVFRGSPEAKKMIIGEAPGYNEDKDGFPFVGKAGKLLDQWFQSVGWDMDTDWYITNTIKCLKGDSRVQTEDGWMRIDDLVKRRYTGRVLSVNEHGTCEWNRVIGWHRSPLSNRRLLKLQLQHARYNLRGPVGAILTEDHRVLTDRGYIEVKDLDPNQHKIHSGRTRPSQDIEDALIGTILGDAHVSQKTNSTVIRHSVAQKAYVHHKHELFRVFENKSTLTYQPSNKSLGFQLGATGYMRNLVSRFVDTSGRKTITIDSLERFTAITLAYWFMDDGHMRLREGRQGLAEIATCSFQEDEIDILIHHIEQLGINCYKRKNEYTRIYFDAENSKKLSRIIAPYVCPSMSYKLLPEDRAVLPKPLDQKTVPFFDHFILHQIDTTPKATRRTTKDGRKIYQQVKTVYCIDVANNHNFMTHSGIVHNCRPVAPKGSGKQNLVPTKAQKEACRPYIEYELDTIQPHTVVLVGAVATKSILSGIPTNKGQGDLVGRLYLSDRWPETRFFVMYHPSYILRSQSRPQLYKELTEATEQHLQTLKDIVEEEEQE